MRVLKTLWVFVAASYFLGLAVEVASTASGSSGPAYSYSPQQQQWYGQQGQYGEPQQQMQQPEEHQQSQEPELSSSEESRENLSQLPSGWTEHLDPASGQYYYYNSADGTTTWDKPPPLESHEPKDEPSSPEVQENSPPDAAPERFEDSSPSKDAGPSEASFEPSGMGQQINFADPDASSFQKDEPTKEEGGQSSGQIQPDAWQPQNPGWGMPPGDSSKVPEKQQQLPAGWGLPSNQQQQPPRQVNQFDPPDPRSVSQPQQWQQHPSRVGQQQESGGQQQPSGQQQQHYQQNQQQQRGPVQAQGWGMPPGDKPPVANPQSGSSTHWGLPPQAQGNTQQAPARSQGGPPQVQGTPPLSGGRPLGMNVPPHLQQQPQSQGQRQQAPPQYQQGSSSGQKPPGQQQQPPQQQPQQQQPRQGNAQQQYSPPGQFNPYSQYGSYGQYAAGQYGSYGGGPPRPPGQLTTQPIESTVSQALGGAWQGLLGFGKKTTEVVGQAKDTVAAKAAEATQTLSATSSSE
jgi:WW domain